MTRAGTQHHNAGFKRWQTFSFLTIQTWYKWGVCAPESMTTVHAPDWIDKLISSDNDLGRCQQLPAVLEAIADTQASQCVNSTGVHLGQAGIL